MPAWWRGSNPCLFCSSTERECPENTLTTHLQTHTQILNTLYSLCIWNRRSYHILFVQGVTIKQQFYHPNQRYKSVWPFQLKTNAQKVKSIANLRKTVQFSNIIVHELNLTFSIYDWSLQMCIFFLQPPVLKQLNKKMGLCCRRSPFGQICSPSVTAEAWLQRLGIETHIPVSQWANLKGQ